MIIKKEDIKDPFVSPLGFKVYEMIGQGDEPIKAKNFSFIHITMPQNKSSSIHFHKETEELHYVISGEGEWIVDGTSHKLVKGMAISLPLNKHHQVKNIGKTDLEFIEFASPGWTESDYFEV